MTNTMLRRFLGVLTAAALMCITVAAGCERPVPHGDVTRSAFSEAAPRDTSDLYTQKEPSRDGTGKVYMGREIAQVMGHRGAAWLERPERAETELPERVVRGLVLDSSDVVADIGAGTGYFTFRVAPEVPRGTVYAVDIQPEMLDIIRRRVEEHGVSNVEPVRGTVQDPNLPGGAVDVAFIVDAYHEFSYPREMVQGIAEALRPGGRLVLVEYRGEDPTVPIKPLHKMTETQVRREIEAAGLRWRETKDMLPQQHFVVFEKPMDAVGGAP